MGSDREFIELIEKAYAGVEPDVYTEDNASVCVTSSGSISVIAIAGTDDWKDVLQDLRWWNWKRWFPGKTTVEEELGKGRYVHTGAWNHSRTVRRIIDSLALGQVRLYVGHSLGGSVAEVLAVEDWLAGVNSSVITYGAPRTGNRAFCNLLDSMIDPRRVENCRDVVPKLPVPRMRHPKVGHEYIDATGIVRTRKVWLWKLRDKFRSCPTVVTDHLLASYKAVLAE